jgi:tRNA(His) 5'-end guanylyltransferase
MNRNTLSLGDRMKKYEDVLDCKLNPCMEYMIRLDGKGFSKMIKKWKCEKPFDERFNKAMNYASKKIFDIIPNVKTIWHGSDEISVWFECENVADMYFEGRIQKLVSLVASTVSVYFNKKLQEEFGCELPFGIFDARIMQFPNKMEVSNYFIFRQHDHIRNSISGYAQYYFSHKELTNKNSDEKIEMMKEKGFDWNKDLWLPNELWSKYGTFLWKEQATIYKNDDEFYIRTMICKTSEVIAKPDKFGILLPKYVLRFTENEWKNTKENEE